MADVLVIPGIERRDLVGAPTPPEQVLKHAIEEGITDVVLVGRCRDGSPYYAGSMNDIDKVVGILFSAATWLAGGRYEQGIRDEKPEPEAG